jgi:iron-sulfur cluster protein
LPSRRKFIKRAKKALGTESLQKALEKAASHHFSEYARTREEIPWNTIKKTARTIREKNLKRLPQLILKFKEEAEQSGAHVILASDVPEALSAVKTIVQDNNARTIVKSKSMVSEEMELNPFLEGLGCEVIETDLGEWIVQLAREKPSHITAPALHKTKEEIAELLSQKLNKHIPPDSEVIVKLAREEMRRSFIQADIGISGANLAVAESGTLALVSNEGNARLVTSLPPVHIAIVTTEKFVETLEEATVLIKAQITASSGKKMTSYVSWITGPSRTTDIEKELVVGVHGPQEVHIIILDNGRLHHRKDKDLNQTLYCLKCGGCSMVCPVFQSLGGHVYGGPVYPGGIGLLLTEILDSFDLSKPLLDFCADCKKCEEFCPVGIPTGELLCRLKEKKGSYAWEKFLSKLFGQNLVTEWGASFLSLSQKLWMKDGHLKKLPLPWTKGKRLPALREKMPILPESGQKGKRVYFFQGCLSKFFFPDLRESVRLSLVHFGYRVVIPEAQTCCGAPSLHLGQTKDVQKRLRTNWESFKKEKPDYILTICPTGNAMLKNTYPQLEPDFLPWAEHIYDYSEFLVKQRHVPETADNPRGEKVLYHYPCHYLNALKLKDEPKKILASSGYTPVEEDEPYTCCGFCGVFSVKNPEISTRLWQKKRTKITASQASTIATDCPGCVFQLKACLMDESRTYNVHHTAELFARSVLKGKHNEAKLGDNPPGRSD